MSQSIIQKHLPAKAVSPADGHCFFGYFDKFATDEKDERILVHKVGFTARQPRLGDKALIGLIEGNDFTPVAETLAWNWQQGSMLQWFSRDSIIYNDLEGDTYVARIHNLVTGARRTLCRPVYCLSPDGRWAMSLNFSRLDRERPGYGYPGAFDPNEKVKCPGDEGIWLVDLKNNTAKLVVSVAQVTDAWYRSDMEDTEGWFNHILISPDSRRFAFFLRWRLKNKDGSPGWHLTHMFTANLDGTELFPLNLEEMSSHYTWICPDQIINFSNRYTAGWQYYLYTDRTHHTEIIGRDLFPGDGHCSYSPDGKWMLTDSYPLEDNCRRLFLYRLSNGEAFEIGSFHSDPAYPVPTRCDLHPNWSRDGRSVCIDSIHEGSRQVYILDVSELTAR